jgi:DNA (cytosine-5)-methyltransferase 1
MLDLFSGIGGFSLAAEWVWEDELDIVGFCEIEKYAQKVLQKNFPGVPIYEDITKLNGKDFKNIDLLTGGFPCQDISIAGKGEGITGKRSGLWTEMHRVISEIRPRYALIENVPMLIHRGLERVLCDLAQIGYDAEWQIVGADDVGAWHRRKRIWIVAYPDGNRLYKDKIQDGFNNKSIEGVEDWTNYTSLYFEAFGNRYKSIPNHLRMVNGFPNELDKINQRIKGLGNAIVPQVAALIMERIKNA